MNMDLALQTFLDESRELLSDMEQILLDLENRPGETELQNALFRCVHTVKGSAGMFGLDHVVNFTHVVENVLDRLRSDEISLTRDLANLLLRCRDHISLLVEVPEPSKATDLEPAGDSLLAELTPYQSLSAAPDTQSSRNDPKQSSETGLWRIRMQIQADALRHGMDPLGFVRFLGTLGELEQVSVLDQALPPLDAFDPEACYLGFDVSLRTSADRAAIEDVFEFAGDLYQLDIEAPGQQQPEHQSQATEESTGQLPTPSKPKTQEDEPAEPVEGRRKKAVQHLRIQADKLDKLINRPGIRRQPQLAGGGNPRQLAGSAHGPHRGNLPALPASGSGCVLRARQGH
jgi:two-component system, chemotaxis family, sensor kinase CheA